MKTFSEKRDFIIYHLSNGQSSPESNIDYLNTKSSSGTMDSFELIQSVKFSITNSPEDNNTNSHYQQVDSIEEIVLLLISVGNYLKEEVRKEVDEFMERHEISFNSDLYLSVFC